MSTLTTVGEVFSCQFAASHRKYLISLSLHVAPHWTQEDSVLMWQWHTLLWLNLRSEPVAWNTAFLQFLWYIYVFFDLSEGFSSFKIEVYIFLIEDDSFIFMYFVHHLREKSYGKRKWDLISWLNMLASWSPEMDTNNCQGNFDFCNS